jgi:hypothetical protein
MEITGCVEEAAAALCLPRDLRQIIRTISYDSGDQEWYSTCHDFQEPMPGEVFLWALRLIGWLQYNYPQGPLSQEVSCC